MATVVLNPDVMLDSGVAVTYTALATGNTYKVRNNGKTVLYFKKLGANPCTVTMATNGTVKGKALAAVTFVVPATTGDVHAGPFPAEVYDDINHDLSFTVSEATSLSVAVLQLP